MLLSRIVIIVLFFLQWVSAQAQYFYSYKDTFGYLYTYDDGYIRRMGDMPITVYAFGTKSAAFINNLDEFKVSFETGSQVLAETPPKNFTFSRAMLTYEQSNSLFVYWNQRVTRLSFFNGEYSTQDSIVCFYDRANTFKVFYNGTTYNVNNVQLRDYKAKRNIVAFNSQDFMFKVFLRGKLRTLEKYEVTDYQVGLNTAAYLDQTGRLRVYNSGKVYDVEELTPQFYTVADNIVVYHTRNNDFKVFYKDSAYKLETFLPANYWVQDGLLYYTDENNRLKVFDRGQVLFVSFFTPKGIKVFDNTLLFLDIYNNLYCYRNGEVKNISGEAVRDYYINGDLIVYYAQVNDIVFVGQGKPYRVKNNWQRF